LENATKPTARDAALRNPRPHPESDVISAALANLRHVHVLMAQVVERNRVKPAAARDSRLPGGRGGRIRDRRHLTLGVAVR